jgi:hypothetical protein
LQDAVGAGVDRQRRQIAPGDDTVLVDDKKRTLAKSIAFSIGAIELGDGALRLEVGKQREFQLPVKSPLFFKDFLLYQEF